MKAAAKQTHTKLMALIGTFAKAKNTAPKINQNIRMIFSYVDGRMRGRIRHVCQLFEGTRPRLGLVETSAPKESLARYTVPVCRDFLTQHMVPA